MKTIEDIRNRDVAVHNNGTLEQLKEVLCLAFPEDERRIYGHFQYYFAHSCDLHKWDLSDQEPVYPIQSVKDFIKEIRDKETTLKEDITTNWEITINTEEMENKEQEYELVDFKIEDLKEGAILENSSEILEVQGLIGKVVISITTEGYIRQYTPDMMKRGKFKLVVPKPKIEKIQGFEVCYYPDLPLIEVSEYEDFRVGSCNIAQLIKVTENGSFVTSISGLWKYCRPVPLERRNFIDFEE